MRIGPVRQPDVITLDRRLDTILAPRVILCLVTFAYLFGGALILLSN